MFENTTPLFNSITWADVLINLGLSFILGLVVANVYKLTQKGLKYSISLMHTLIFLSLIVSFVMMIIGSDIARAFSLVGALSVIRFRTAIKDTKDTSFVFWALAVGMATGVGYFQVAIVGTVFIGAMIVLTHFSRMGILRRKEILLKFSVESAENKKNLPFEEVFSKYLIKYNLLNIQTYRQGELIEMSYIIKFRDENQINQFSKDLSALPALDRVSLIICEDDEWTDNVI